jgi:purine-binding chemotaxis protein CheW
MTFELAGEAYGLDVMRVREFVGLVEITRMPGAPAFVRGVVHLRGRAIPVIDLRVKLGLPGAGRTDEAVIIVLQCRVEGREITMGVVVDRVLEVVAFAADAIDPPPILGEAAGGDLFLGVGKLTSRFVFLLDGAAVLCEAAAGLPSTMGDGAGSPP